MLPKNNRLNLKTDFTWVASGQKAENNLIKIFFRFNQNSEARIGITSPKSVFKKAVDRNRARRLISTGFEKLYNKLPAGLNIIALPKAGVLNLDSELLTTELEKLLKKEKLI